MLEASANGFQALANGQHHSEEDDVSKIPIQFYTKPVMDEEKSRKEGRPCYSEVHYIKIKTPGDKDNVIDRPVNEVDIRRFGKAYMTWKDKGLQPENTGTPLSAWPQVTVTQVAELEYFGVRTVEQLAALSDSNAQKMGPITELRNRAKNYVAAAAGEAPLVKMQAELEKRDEAFRSQASEVEQLKAALKAQAEQLEKLQRNQGGNGNQPRK